jgi:hypothetical protein
MRRGPGLYWSVERITALLVELDDGHAAVA